MAEKFRKIPQPPIDLQARPSESRPIWLGLLIAAAGAAVLLTGLRKTHPIASAGRDRSPEYLVVQAVTAEAFAKADTESEAPGQAAVEKTPADKDPTEGQSATRPKEKAGGLKIDPDKIENTCPT